MKVRRNHVHYIKITETYVYQADEIMSRVSLPKGDAMCGCGLSARTYTVLC
jgi:hypothetical protein